VGRWNERNRKAKQHSHSRQNHSVHSRLKAISARGDESLPRHLDVVRLISILDLSKNGGIIKIKKDKKGEKNERLCLER
jgi:hypothetical protein